MGGKENPSVSTVSAFGTVSFKVNPGISAVSGDRTRSGTTSSFKMKPEGKSAETMIAFEKEPYVSKPMMSWNT